MRIEHITSESVRESEKIKTLCEAFAQIHEEGVLNDLLPQLGHNFLKRLFYPGLITSSDAIVFAVIDGEKPAAFLAASLQVKQSMKQIALRSLLRTFRFGVMHLLFRPWLWGPVIKTLFITQPGNIKDAAEILMVATAASYRRQGYALQLLDALHAELYNRGVNSCLARVREDNMPARMMYMRKGYRQIGSTIFNNAQWLWLRYDISD